MKLNDTAPLQLSDQFLRKKDADRALRAFKNLRKYEIFGWAIAGSFATEMHHVLRGHPPLSRVLNDLDFITGSFSNIPSGLAADFLFRHVHPFQPPGKIILQAVDSENAVRIDIFRTTPQAMSRSTEINLGPGLMRLVSLEDLVARTARVLCDLTRNIPVPAKHARDYLRLTKLVCSEKVETTWGDHRLAWQPETFLEADRLIRLSISKRQELFFEPQYSTDVTGKCPHCMDIPNFPLADPNAVLSILGYC